MSNRGMVAAIAMISISGFAMSLSYPLFALLLDRMGASAFEIGLNTAAPAVAMLAGGPLLPALLRRIGLPMLLVISALTLALPLLLFKPFADIWVWTGLRFVFGLGAVGAFFGAELWIVAAAPPARRGLLIGVYGLFLSFGFLAGPLALQILPIDGWAPFLLAAGASGFAILPVVWARDLAPRGLGGPARSPLAVLGFFRSDPTVIFAVALFGMIETGGFGLLPIWALKAGMTESYALLLVALIPLGNVLLQIPVGVAADRMNRMRLLIGAGASCTAFSLLIGVFATPGWALIAVMTLFGGVVVALYTVSLSELGHRYAGGDLSRSAGAVMLAYGVGALVAPPLMGWAMDLWPPHGMLWVMGLASAGFAALAAARAARRGQPGGGCARDSA